MKSKPRKVSRPQEAHLVGLHNRGEHTTTKIARAPLD
jgi:hypothetical protein